MAVTQNEVVEQNQKKFKLNWLPLVMGIITLLVIFLSARWYQQWASWEFGLDATAPEFDIYWMQFFWIEIVVEAVLFVVFVGYIWMTRDRHLDKVTPREELNRLMFWVSMLIVYALSFYFAGSFFAEQDATWHQTVVRDTSFTPSHIILFYMSMPVFIIIGFSLFFYAMTRIPYFAREISIPLIAVVCGPFMLLPTVGFNEWGHAFWIMEEYFTVPLHWGFVFFGWSIIALGGLLYQVVNLLHVLLPQVVNEKGELTS